MGVKEWSVLSHKCEVLPLHRQVFLLCSSLIYCGDIFTDLYVAVETLVFRQNQTTLGFLMLSFVLLPLVYSNYIALRNRRGRARYRSREPGNCTVFWIEGGGGVVRRSLAPFPWDSPCHVLFNCLCVLQLGVLIDVAELLSHREQAISLTSWQYSHYTYIRRLEVMLENCPQIVLQVCALAAEDQFFQNLLAGSLTTAEIIRIVSLACSVVSLPLGLCADEEAGRYCSRVDYDLLVQIRFFFISLNLQLLVLYLGYLLMIVSRIVLVALVYAYAKEAQMHVKLWSSGPNLVAFLFVELHHLVVLSIYAVNQRMTRRKKSVIVIEEMTWCNMIMSFFLFSFSEVFVILLQFPVRYRRAIRSRSKEKDKGDERFKSFYLLFLLNVLEFLGMALFCELYPSGLQVKTNHYRWVVYASTTCYLLSGSCFILYHSPLLHPDSRRQRAPYKSWVGMVYGLQPLCAEENRISEKQDEAASQLIQKIGNSRSCV